MHILSASFAGERALAILRNNRTGVVRGSHDAGFYCRMEDGSLLLAHEDGFGVIPFGLGFPPVPSGAFGGKRFPEGMTLCNRFEDRQLLLYVGSASAPYTVMVNGAQVGYNQSSATSQGKAQITSNHCYHND